MGAGSDSGLAESLRVGAGVGPCASRYRSRFSPQRNAPDLDDTGALRRSRYCFPLSSRITMSISQPPLRYGLIFTVIALTPEGTPRVFRPHPSSGDPSRPG